MSYLFDLKMEVKSISKFMNVLNNLDIEKVCQGYRVLRDVEAPIRSRSYFWDTHNGIPSSGETSTSREDHLAIALFNASQDGKEFELPDKRSINIIDYQTPLKEKRSDEGIGAIDLFAVISENIPTVIELKIEGLRKGLADNPLFAVIEGLIYCAIIERNILPIVNEANTKFNLNLSAIPPELIVLSREEYWKRHLQNPNTCDWLHTLNAFIEQLKLELKLDIHLISMKDVDFKKGLNETRPILQGACNLEFVDKIAIRYS